MMWQDVIVSVASIIFAYAMLPQIYYGLKTKKGLISIQLSLLNILGMVGLIIVYLSLNLYFSTLISIIVTVLWIVLLLQRLFYGKVK